MLHEGFLAECPARHGAGERQRGEHVALRPSSDGLPDGPDLRQGPTGDPTCEPWLGWNAPAPSIPMTRETGQEPTSKNPPRT